MQTPLLDELETLADRALVEVTELERQRDELDAAIKRLKSFHRSVYPTAPSGAKSNGHRNGRRQAPVAATQRLREVANYILHDYSTQDTFTATDVYMGMGSPFTKSLIYSIFNHYRSIEFLGKVGKDPETKRDLWQILDPDAISRIDD